MKETKDEIFELYNNVLNGKIKIFPKGTWNKSNSKDDYLKLLKYVIEDKYKMTDEEILLLEGKWFVKNKLGGGLYEVFGYKMFDAINSLYPNKFKIYEMKHIPSGYWDIDTSVEAINYYMEKDNITDYSELNKRWFEDHGIYTALKAFNYNIKKLLKYFKEE